MVAVGHINSLASQHTNSIPDRTYRATTQRGADSHVIDRTLAEAILSSDDCLSPSVRADSAESFLRQWMRVYFKRGPLGFVQRLRQDNVNLDVLLHQLASPAAVHPSAFSSVLDDFLGADPRLAWDHAIAGLPDDFRSSSFAAITARALCLAEMRLSVTQESSGKRATLTDEAARDLRNILSTRISALFGVASQATLLANSNHLASVLFDAECSLRRGSHSDFRFSILQVRPLLRALVILLHNWVEFTSLMLSRLSKDASLLEQHFGVSVRPTAVVHRVHDTCSDPHRDGATVVILDLGCAKQLLYKPRPSCGEAEVFSLIQKFSDCHSLGLTTPQVLCVGAHAWATFVQADSGRVPSMRLLEGVGSLLAILYALRVEDAHQDNVLVVGDTPVLVDGEIFCYSGRDLALELPRRSQPLRRYSVADTGILPGTYLVRVGDRKVDLGFIGVVPPASDDSTILGASRPGVTIEPGVLLDALKRGFHDAYCLISAELSAGVFQKRVTPLAEKRSRLLIRATAHYRLLLDTSFGNALGSVAEWSLSFERLADTFLGMNQPEKAWAIFRSEVRQLEGLNIPVFYVDLADGGIYDDKELVGATVPAPWKLLEKHFAEFGKEDMDCQMAIIDASFFYRNPTLEVL
jgi:hypothetical protein